MHGLFWASQSAALWRAVIIATCLLVAYPTRSVEPDDKAPRPEGPRTPERVQVQGVENAFRLSPRLYSGGEPQGDAAFSALKALGVKTIISIDGARPDVETAHKFGMRYVHLPVGYDGVGKKQATRIIEAAKAFPGPVFVHCHHGKHRGPTAAALCGIAAEGWSKDEAVAWLKQVGTSPEYRGLFATVNEFVVPSADEPSRVGSDFPERAKLPALVEAMVQVDKRWHCLRAIHEAGFRTPLNQPDLDPPHEALQLAEHFRELLGLEETKAKGENFCRKMEDAERSATALQDALKRICEENAAPTRKRAEAALVAAGKSCTACHALYRDN